MKVRALIDTLNNLTVGELGTLASRVGEVRSEAAKMGLDEVAAILDEALGCLDRCDLKGFRKKIQHAVSRLGHVKEKDRPLAGQLPPSVRRRSVR
ncbi:MAG: hypothetical protein D6718_01050 [Acidobacteria bacterium]|nr:MAG: hypothetical protein D6718_01050 [Acidobacteriota bacterium]